MAGSKLQSQISGFAGRTQQTDQLFEDGITAGVTLGLDLLKDLLGRIGMAFEHRHDLAFEGIELAGPLAGAPLLVAGALDPLLGGLEVQVQFGGDLRGAQLLLIGQPPDFAECFVTDHGEAPAPSTRRRMSPADCSRPERSWVAGLGDESSAST